MEDWRHGGFGLYIHWPFCTSKCPYCDFNSHVAQGPVEMARWSRAYTSEIARIGAETGGRVLNSVFFGGGTPSLMAPELISEVLAAVRATWPLANDVEITLEANPGSIEAGRFRAFAEAGVNRISMGMQAMNDADLRRLGRIHTAAEARAAFDIARSNFDRVSFDLIYARQGQDLAAWRRELGEALAMAVDHLSLYQLTIEEGTIFGARHAVGRLPDLPDEELGADLYLVTQEICAAAGFPGYEISNHARIGAESRHNLIYWRQGDYAGIGPGAHGRLTLAGRRAASETSLAPTAWLSAVETSGNGEIPRAFLSRAEQAAEHMMMGLRLSEGISLSRHEALAGSAVDAGRLAELQELEMIEVAGDRLKTTAQGRPVLNALLRALLA